MTIEKLPKLPLDMTIDEIREWFAKTYSHDLLTKIVYHDLADPQIRWLYALIITGGQVTICPARHNGRTTVLEAFNKDKWDLKRLDGPVGPFAELVLRIPGKTMLIYKGNIVVRNAHGDIDQMDPTLFNNLYEEVNE